MANRPSTPSRELTPTSFGILGLLATRPWSTYELAAQMRRNLHYLWPRAESNVYAELKRLAESGHARTRSEPVGRRPRTVYSITPKGRRALERWLAKPASAFRVESEALVKLLFSPFGSREDALSHLARLSEEFGEREAELTGIFGEYLADEDRFPDRVHINVVLYRLLWDITQTVSAWADWAAESLAEPASRAEALQVLEDALKQRRG